MADRVVVDTNVFVAALRSADGTSRSILRMCLLGECEPVMSIALFLEYEDVLGRPGLFSRSPLSAEERDELLDAFLNVSDWTEVFFLWRPNLPDEGDNHLIELAVASAASKIITYNTSDLRRGELKFPQIAVVTPAEFLEDWNLRHGNDDDSNP